MTTEPTSREATPTVAWVIHPDLTADRDRRAPGPALDEAVALAGALPGLAVAGAEVVRLKPKEYDLLIFLARNRGIALSRDLILERVWGWEYDGGSRTVDVHVRWLREKIEPDPANARRIVTVRGIGYRFEG